MAIKTIGIDIRSTFGNGAGKGRYTEEITKAMIRIAPDIQFLLFTDKLNEKFPDAHNAQQVEIPSKGIFWHFALRRYLLKNPIDFYFAPSSFIYPAIAPRSQKLAIVVHDMVALLFPQNHYWFPTFIERLTLGFAIKNSAFIATISQNTWTDLVRIKPAAKTKTPVFAPPAVTSSFHQTAESSRLSLPSKFILTVGTIEPRKNHSKLVEAYILLAGKYTDLHLCIAGAQGWKSSNLTKSIPEKLRSKIHFLGYTPFENLPELYSRAALLAYPSLYEGFGIPPLEAMACGTPVLTSNTSSLPEVVGDAAVKVNPTNVEEIVTGIEELLKNPEPYRAKGFERAKLFSWENSALAILNAI